MKRIITLITLLQCLLCSSQNLSLDELISLRKKNIAEVEEYLSNKNWSFLRSKEPDMYNLGQLVFTYKKSTYDDKAESFLNFFYSTSNQGKRIVLQINSKDKYNTYLNKVKSLGCKLIDTKVEQGTIRKIYKGKTLTFLFNIGTNNDEFSLATSTVYGLFILENSDYKKSFTNYIAPEGEIVDSLATQVPSSYDSDRNIFDIDGDGVLDENDMCPEVKGLASNYGCPEVSKEAKNKINDYRSVILFNEDKSSFTFAAFQKLKSIVAIMKEYPNSNYRIEGHTDNVEKNDFKLSEARANAVKYYLIDNGISSDRLEVVGYGNTRPGISNKSERGKADNRRVVIILKKLN